MSPYLPHKPLEAKADGRPLLEVPLMFTFARSGMALQTSLCLASIISVDCMKV